MTSVKNEIEEKPIRIAQIIGKWVGGGVEAVVMNYYKHINHDKIQFDFICDEDSTDIPYEEIEKMGGRVIIVPPYQRFIRYHKALKKVLKEGNYKIVHSHINTLSVFSLFAAKRAGVPIRIAHSHSTTNPIEKKKNIIKQILKPYSKLYATNYMSCSELAGRWLFGNNTFNKGKVLVLNNAIELEKFMYSEKYRREYRKELNINNNMLVIGHVGRFVKQKNHSFLIDIFNEIHKKENNSVLLLIGQGPLKKKIQEKVNELGLTDSVLFLGQRSDVAKLYSVMDVFILPSIYEGLGMVLVEAQVAGCHCVASDCIPKVVSLDNNICFLSVNKDLDRWTKNSLIKNSNRKDMSYEAKCKGFDIEIEVKKLSDFYEKLLNGRKY